MLELDCNYHFHQGKFLFYLVGCIYQIEILAFDLVRFEFEFFFNETKLKPFSLNDRNKPEIRMAIITTTIFLEVNTWFMVNGLAKFSMFFFWTKFSFTPKKPQLVSLANKKKLSLEKKTFPNCFSIVSH